MILRRYRRRTVGTNETHFHEQNGQEQCTHERHTLTNVVDNILRREIRVSAVCDKQRTMYADLIVLQIRGRIRVGRAWAIWHLDTFEFAVA